MTDAVRELVQAHDDDKDFPYLDFLGAFLAIEKIVRNGRDDAHRRLREVDFSGILGMPLGAAEEDTKLGYVLNLIRSHGLEVLQLINGDEPVYN